MKKILSLIILLSFVSIFSQNGASNCEGAEPSCSDENGVKISQSLTFTLLKQDYLSTKSLQEIMQLDLRYIVEYNDGRFRIGGLFKGARITELKLVSGGSKNSLNGYNLTISSEEEYLNI